MASTYVPHLQLNGEQDLVVSYCCVASILHDCMESGCDNVYLTESYTWWFAYLHTLLHDPVRSW